MSELNFPIKRDNLYEVYVYLLNKNLDILNKRIAIYQSAHYFSHSRGFKDVYYETPRYKVIPDIADREEYFTDNVERRNETSIVISNPVKLESLLLNADFGEMLYKQDFINLRTNVFNGKFPFENFELFGYQKKPDMIWKNGILIPNPELENLSDYDINKYELVDEENKLAKFFPLLNEVDYRNPNAIFEPFEEEGPIKKRILTGSDENA